MPTAPPGGVDSATVSPTLSLTEVSDTKWLRPSVDDDDDDANDAAVEAKNSDAATTPNATSPSAPALEGDRRQRATARWDVAADDVAYPPAPPPPTPADDLDLNKKRRDGRRKQRAQYFKNNTSVRRGSVDAIEEMERILTSRLAKEPGKVLKESRSPRERGRMGTSERYAPRAGRIVDSRELGPAAYSMALAALTRERSLSGVKGEGTFSDVYTTRKNEDERDGGGGGGRRKWLNGPLEKVSDDGGGDAPTLPDVVFALDARPVVMKCSVPFPGVIQGRPIGDGLSIGEVEAKVLSALPPHENVVKLHAAFLR